MPIEAVVFDWGGTLSLFAEVDMEDMWRLAARHLAPDREDELCERLVAVEAASWARIAVDQRATTLTSLLTLASGELGLDVTEAVLEEAATHHLDSWTPHIRHDPDAAGVLAGLRERGLRIGLLSNTHWPPAFHEHFLERDGLAGLIDVRCYTSEMTFTKPHPDAFRAVLDALGVARPDRAVTVFAGADIEATAKARSYFAPYQPSSPQIGLFKDGRLVYMMERHQIEQKFADQIADELAAAFRQHCATTETVNAER